MLPNGIKLDDNTSANIAIKRAVLKGMTSSYGIPGKSQLLFGGFETCHIWDKTAYDEKYYSSLPNLVLIPRAIAGLTDHCDAVKDLLKYRSYDLFGAIPGLPVPARPSFYTKIIWR